MNRKRVLAALLASVVLFHVTPVWAQGTIVAGPYFPRVDRTSVDVAFELDTPAKACVVVRDPSFERTVESETEGPFHIVTVSGLAPGKAYDYAIEVAGTRVVGFGAHKLRTAVLPGESFSFVCIGDTRPGENNVTVHHQALVEQMSLFDPAFSLVLGDLVDRGDTPSDWHDFFRVEKDLLGSTAIFPVLGDNDHMEGKGIAAEYFPALETGYYTFEWGGIHFFGLNAWDTTGIQPQSTFDAKSEQYRWLAEALKKPDVQAAPFRIVFMHDPVVISRGRASDVFHQTYAPLFEANRVDLVFAAAHLYERSRVGGVTYVISGGGGAELIWESPSPGFRSIADAKRHHFVRVDVGTGGVELRAIAQDRTVLDQVTLAPSVGEQTRHDEFQRFAARMATKKTFGTGEVKVPVYLFQPGSHSGPFDPTFEKAGKELELTVELYTYDLRKKQVFDLLLHALQETNEGVDKYPVIFVGTQHTAHKPDVLFGGIAAAPNHPTTPLFKEQKDLSDLRIAVFNSIGAFKVMGYGVLQAFTVGGLLGLALFSLAIALLKRNGKPALKLGAGAIGIFFGLHLAFTLLYYDIIKHIPFIDGISILFCPVGNSMTFFTLQAMLEDPSFRTDALIYFQLFILPSIAPALFLLFVINRFVRVK